MGVMMLLIVMVLIVAAVTFVLARRAADTRAQAFRRGFMVLLLLCPVVFVSMFVLGLSGVVSVEKWVYRGIVLVMLASGVGVALTGMSARRTDTPR